MSDSNMIEVLLVEDNPNDAELAIRSLKKHNLANNLVWVKDGQEALDFLFGKGTYSDRETKNTPRVILLDLKLPKINGLEVLAIIKKNSLTKRIPVVMLTSSREESDLVSSYKSGVNSYIVKPVAFDKFVESVKEIGYYWMVVNQPPGV